MGKMPKLKIAMTKTDKIIELIILLIIIAVFIYVGLSWDNIPKTVPTHYNVSGEIDGYGSKSTIIFMLPVIIIMYTMFSIFSKYPHIFNYIVKITPENMENQYRMAIQLLRIMKLEIVLVFSWIVFSMIRSALYGESKLGTLFVPIELIVIFVTLGIYFYRSVRAK